MDILQRVNNIANIESLKVCELNMDQVGGITESLKAAVGNASLKFSVSMFILLTG